MNNTTFMAKKGEIERVYNFKYPFEYLTDFDEMKLRKEKAINIINKWQKP